MSDKPTVSQLISRSYDEQPIQQRATLLEAVELADAQGDLDAGFHARDAYVFACHNAPNPLMMIAHYGWMLARHDEDPERFSVSLWTYKWVLNAAPKFAGVSSEQLTELVDDMTRRFDAVGASKGPVGVAACTVAAALGATEDLAVLLDGWMNTPKTGHLNDCLACDTASETYFRIVLGQYAHAIEGAKLLINRDRSCTTQPHGAFANLLQACRAVGDEELANTLSVAGLDLLTIGADFTQPYGNHLRHFAITRQLQAGLALLREMAKHADGDDRTLFDFYRGARLVLRLADEHRSPDLAALHEQFDGRAEEIAARFDARNNNTYVSGLLAADDAEFNAVTQR